MRSILLDHCKTVGNKERQMSLALVRTPANSSALDVAAEANHRIGNNLSLIAGLARQSRVKHPQRIAYDERR
jgi:two-component sensor histidine kinase